MKLLFDENLSSVLPAALADCYGESRQVRDVGLKASSDADVWAHAARNGLAIVTKDSDFRGSDWATARRGRLKALLRRRIAEVIEFLADDLKAFLVLS